MASGSVATAAHWGLSTALVTPEIVMGVSLWHSFSGPPLYHCPGCMILALWLFRSPRGRRGSPAADLTARRKPAMDWAWWGPSAWRCRPCCRGSPPAMLALAVSFDDYVITSMVAGGLANAAHVDLPTPAGRIDINAFPCLPSILQRPGAALEAIAGRETRPSLSS
jgi:hypothetical protein